VWRSAATVFTGGFLHSWVDIVGVDMWQGCEVCFMLPSHLDFPLVRSPDRMSQPYRGLPKLRTP
jgi:hypothetical protein